MLNLGKCTYWQKSSGLEWHVLEMKGKNWISLRADNPSPRARAGPARQRPNGGPPSRTAGRRWAAVGPGSGFARGVRVYPGAVTPTPTRPPVRAWRRERPACVTGARALIWKRSRYRQDLSTVARAPQESGVRFQRICHFGPQTYKINDAGLSAAEGRGDAGVRGNGTRTARRVRGRKRIWRKPGWGEGGYRGYPHQVTAPVSEALLVLPTTGIP